jgi:hypothetical protein
MMRGDHHRRSLWDSQIVWAETKLLRPDRHLLCLVRYASLSADV